MNDKEYGEEVEDLNTRINELEEEISDLEDELCYFRNALDGAMNFLCKASRWMSIAIGVLDEDDIDEAENDQENIDKLIADWTWNKR